jgi:dipeptidyl aminopeptidase/acylaminoacyl peptidase
MRVRLTAFVVLAVLTSARAEPPVRNHDVTTDDYFSLAVPTEVALSPGSRFVAYADTRWQKSSDDRKADLWIVDCTTGKSRRLTLDRCGAHSLRWAPDGESIYYLAARRRESEKKPPFDGTTQVWHTTLSGRTRAITRVANGVNDYQIDRAARSLYYSVSVPAGRKGPFSRLKEELSSLTYGEGDGKVSQVWRLDLDSWRAEKVMDAGRSVREMALSPAGTRLALITTPDDTVVTFEGQSRVEVYDAKTKKTTMLPDKVFRADAPSPYGWLEGLAWAPAGNMLAFNVVFDGYPAEIIVGRLDSEWSTWKMRRAEGIHVRGYGSPLGWSASPAEPKLYFLGERAGVVSLWETAIDPEARGKERPVNRLGDGPVVIDAFSPAPAEREGPLMAMVMGTPEEFREVWLLGKDRKPRRLTRLNPQTETWKLPKVSRVSWKGANGDKVEGILELPAGHKEGTPLPLVVALHGGPTTGVHFQLDYDLYLGRMFLPARGYAVLCPNYRGSTGYGDKFLTALIGRENDLDVKDILAGVDALVESKTADPKRLAVMGWSNGGYLTNCVISKTTRFRAAASGAGILDTVMEWGANDEPAYMVVLKGGLPWEKPDVYRRTSPTYQLNKIRTPTLIHVGANDERCPPVHSRMLHRALKLYNKVPTELITYPKAPHGLTTYGHRRAKMLWEVAWFDRFVLGKKD